MYFCLFLFTGKGGKNRRRGKNENESEKRELVFKEDGQGKSGSSLFCLWVRRVLQVLLAQYNAVHRKECLSKNCQVNKTLTL